MSGQAAAGNRAGAVRDPVAWAYLAAVVLGLVQAAVLGEPGHTLQATVPYLLALVVVVVVRVVGPRDEAQLRRWLHGLAGAGALLAVWLLGRFLVALPNDHAHQLLAHAAAEGGVLLAVALLVPVFLLVRADRLRPSRGRDVLLLGGIALVAHASSRFSAGEGATRCSWRCSSVSWDGPHRLRGCPFGRSGSSLRARAERTVRRLQAHARCRGSEAAVSRRTTRLMKRARSLESKKKWEEARRVYLEVLDRAPTDAHAWLRLGRIHERRGNWLEAADAYRRAVTLGVDREPAHFRLGRALQKIGNWPEARAAYLRAEAYRDRPPTSKGIRNRQLPYAERVALGLMKKPAYAYLLMRGARLARRLGFDRLTVVEFGVAGGNGLLAMERHAADIESMTGVRFDVAGFDTGEGLVPPADHRDLPYTFAAGNYAMDRAALEQRLTRAQLVLGDAGETFPEFLRSLRAPIGAISFDMDLYSATKAVLDAMRDEADEQAFLPRVPLYFDDVVGRGLQEYNDFTGELLAIGEFNEENEHTKVAEDRYFRTLPLNAEWHHGIYTMHRFKNPNYDTYVSGAGPQTLALRG